MSAKRNPVDWEAIEREYRAGQLSVREIADQHGVSHTAINKRAKADGWTRDLAKQVRQRVSAQLVSSEVSNANAQQAVETAAARGVELVRQHRRTLSRANTIVEKLLAELERGTDNLDVIEEEIEEVTKGDTNSKRRNAMLKAVSLPQRASTAAALSLTLKNVIPLERQAFSLDAPDEDQNKRSVVDLSDEALAAIASGSSSGTSEAA